MSRASILLATAVLGTGDLGAQQSTGSMRIVPILSARVRTEGWDWFGDDPHDAYAYSHLLVRFGAERLGARFGWRVEGAAPVVVGLPDDATQGHGAAYFRANDARRAVARLFPKQMYLTAGKASAGHRAMIGRFEFSDGGETMPQDAGLATVKRGSVMQRLIGPFGFTEGARSLDGVAYDWSGRRTHVSLVGAMPTEGVFSLDGQNHVSEMKVGYAAVTGTAPWTRAPSEWRLFAVGFRDARRLPKVDNRPASIRGQDSSAVSVQSLGGHLLQLWPTPRGPVDIALWGAAQFGSWGIQRHEAWAADMEVGWRPLGLPWNPWLRAGVFRTSGDRNPGDAVHGTFYQTLATPRLFARFPFYNLTNVFDRSASLTLRPRPALTIRSDVRRVELGESADGWYQGSGPFDRSSPGLGIRPSQGARGLATLVDASAELRLAPHWNLSAYLGQALAGPVVGKKSPGRFGFVEVEFRL